MKKYKYFIPAILLMVIIFFMSHQPGNDSMQTSNFIVDLLKHIFSLPNTYEDILSTIVRKGAHMSEYALLAILLFYGFYNTFKNRPIFQLTFFTTFLYACTDEFHQLFIVGRSGQISDVLVDSGGALIGLFIIYCILCYQKKHSILEKGE